MAADRAPESLLPFRAAGRRLAIEASRVREIDRPRHLTTVPHAPDSLLGLINLRGIVLPVISMAGLLDRPRGDMTRIIVIEGAKPFGLAVDQVEAVVDGAGSAAEGAERIDLDGLVAARFADLATRPATRGERARGARKRKTVAKGHALATFLVAGQEFALPLSEIIEVIPLPANIARLPHADPAVIGTAAWREGLLPILSLARLLALPDDRSVGERVIVTRIGAYRVGLMVAAMRDVITVDPGQLDPLPPILTREQGEARIDAIARLDGGRRLVSVLAADRLVNEALTELLTTAGSADSAVQAEQVEEGLQVLLFKLGVDRFGLPLEAIDEVRRRPSSMTALPKAPDFVPGVINLRDRVVPVIDQGHRFGATRSESRHLIVASSGTLQAAFLVDAILGTVRVAPSMLAEMPAVSGEQAFEHILDIGDGERLTLILNAFELLAGTERAMLAAFGAGKASIRP